MDNKELDYVVDISSFSQNRPKGISGILRVKNDAEFLSDCIESCIQCLDELIIVYNDCTDNSPDIIEEKKKKYSSKIKVFEYKSFLYSGNLTEGEYINAKSMSYNSIHMLSNYCNYALSKCNFKYIMKIDADQIYYTPKLKKICDSYRSIEKVKFNIKEIALFCWVLSFFIFGSKFKIKIPLKKTSLIFDSYFSTVLKLIVKYKLSISLSGINVWFYKNELYIPLGKHIKESIDILPPYNGVGDTSVFELTNKTYFIPFDSVLYNKMNNRNYSIIEKLIGVRNMIPVGVCWIHLNANRKNIIKQQISNFENYNNCYDRINIFVKNKFEYYNSKIDNKVFNRRNKIIFSFLHYGISNRMLEYFESLSVNEKGIFSIKNRCNIQ